MDGDAYRGDLAVFNPDPHIVVLGMGSDAVVLFEETDKEGFEGVDEAFDPALVVP
jgi:hypothetical protein